MTIELNVIGSAAQTSRSGCDFPDICGHDHIDGLSRWYHAEFKSNLLQFQLSKDLDFFLKPRQLEISVSLASADKAFFAIAYFLYT
jgi:hypothetical protein